MQFIVKIKGNERNVPHEVNFSCSPSEQKKPTKQPVIKMDRMYLNSYTLVFCLAMVWLSLTCLLKDYF